MLDVNFYRNNENITFQIYHLIDYKGTQNYKILKYTIFKLMQLYMAEVTKYITS